MRGSDRRSGELFSCVDVETRIGADHPLRTIEAIVDEALASLSAEFDALYAGGAAVDRAGDAPSRDAVAGVLLDPFRAPVDGAAGVRPPVPRSPRRSDRWRAARLTVGLAADAPAWDHSTFSKNRDRLLEGEIAARFLATVLAHGLVKRLLSTQHFSADGTLIEAWASLKSFGPKVDGAGPGDDDPPKGETGGATGGETGRNADVDFRGSRRSNATHRSTTDPEAMLYRKGLGMEAKLCFIGHGLMENRSGLIVDARLTLVSGHAERLAALEMIERHANRPRAVTLGADRGYDAADFVAELREMNVRPHVARKARRSAIDGRTTRHAGYEASQRIRKRIEEAFGWIKTIAGLRKSRFIGRARTDWAFTFACAAYNLVRLPKLPAGAG